MEMGMWTIQPRRLNEEFSSKLLIGYPHRHTPAERSKRDHSNKDEKNSLHVDNVNMNCCKF